MKYSIQISYSTDEKRDCKSAIAVEANSVGEAYDKAREQLSVNSDGFKNIRLGTCSPGIGVIV